MNTEQLATHLSRVLYELGYLRPFIDELIDVGYPPKVARDMAYDGLRGVLTEALTQYQPH